MRIHEFARTLIEKFVPISAESSRDLDRDASTWYQKLQTELIRHKALNDKILEENTVFANDADYKPKALLKLPKKLFIINLFEQWYVRYAFAILFMVLVPKIKDYMEGGESGYYDAEQSEAEEIAEILRHKRMRRA